MKMPEKIEAIMFAPCGMNCLVCYKHCYHKNLVMDVLKVTMENQSIAENAISRIVLKIKGWTIVSNAAPIPVNSSTILRKATINVIKPALLITAGWLKIRG